MQGWWQIVGTSARFVSLKFHRKGSVGDNICFYANVDVIWMKAGTRRLLIMPV